MFLFVNALEFVLNAFIKGFFFFKLRHKAQNCNYPYEVKK
jgi:hypothetical protein